MATWLEDDITGEWEWLGSPLAPPRPTLAELFHEQYVPAITRMLDRDSVLFRNVQREFERGAREVVVPIESRRMVTWEEMSRGVAATSIETRRITREQWAEITRLEAHRRELETQMQELRLRMMTPFVQIPPEGLDTSRRLSYDFDSHAHHERLQIAMAEWRPRRRREDEGR
jgi:hypothetical protein